MPHVDKDLVIVGIGASAGGLEAIREVLSHADASQPVGYVVVQHLDPNHQSMMAELLAPHTPLSVHQASGDETVEAGQVYVIPPGHGLSIRGGRLELTQFKQPRGLRRPIDDFFVALAEDVRENAVCVILSGTGADGSSGMRAIKESGGLCVAQEPDTARYDGMPLAAVATGMVDFVRPPAEIASTIAQFFRQRRRESDRRDGADKVAEVIDDLCGVLSSVAGHDFAGYKRSTVIRRIQRRMQVLGMAEGTDYLEHLRGSDEECETLFRELLINVTRFFRDSEQFEQLRETVIEPMVRRNDGDEIRVWVPGCSSGEEAYTLAMLFAAELRDARKSALVQIFATDIDEQMLATARTAIYPTAALIDIPEGYRELYTIGRESSFQIAPRIRDMVRFSSHSLIKDPPFSRLDLISCRNLLIYFGERLQGQALPIFHYALKPGGLLFLGPSETIGRHEDLFLVRDQRARIYVRSNLPPVYPIDLAGTPGRNRARTAMAKRRRSDFGSDPDEEFSVERLLTRYAPPSLRITGEGEILKSYGDFSRFVAVSPTQTGPAFVQNMARRGLKEILPSLMRDSLVNRRRRVVRDVRVVSELGMQAVDVVADPLPDGTLLLVLRPRGDFSPLEGEELEEMQDFDSHDEIVEEELRVTRLRLRSAVEELETANEELKSSNEEMMSMNEELQSTNEELTTVNDELKSKVDELTAANADLKNLFASTELPLVVVDRDLNIRNFTEGACKIFALQAGDRGRPLRDFRTSIADPEALLALVRRTIAEKTEMRDTVRSVDGSSHWALMISPYQTMEETVEGATLVFADITYALDLEDALRKESARLKLALEVANIGFWQYEVESGQTTLDHNARELFDLTVEEAQEIHAVLNRIMEEDRPTVENALRRAISGEADYEAAFRIKTRGGDIRYLRGRGRVVENARPMRLVGVNFDETGDIEAKRLRELMIREMNHRVKNLFSIMSALLRLGARRTASAGELAAFLADRISALARSHDLSIQNASQPLDLAELLDRAIAPYRSGTDLTLSGPPVAVATAKLTSLALIFHEWATNSAKYGALGAKDGQLTIDWHRNEAGRVRLEWKERAAVIGTAKKSGSGFGTQLVQLSLKQIDGEAEARAVDDCWHIDLSFVPENDLRSSTFA